MSEYESLRQEILDNINTIVQYNILLYTSVIAVLAFAFEKESPFLCLLPYVAIIPIYLLVEERRRTNDFIASYMIVFLEGTDHNWETRFHYRGFRRYAPSERKSMIRQVSRMNVPARIPYLFVAFVCSGCAIYKVTLQNYQIAFQNTAIFEARNVNAVIVLFTVITILIMVKHTKGDYELKNSYIKSCKNCKRI